MFQAHIDQWIDFSSLEIDANIMKLYLPRLGFAPYLPPVSYCFVHSSLEYPYVASCMSNSEIIRLHEG